MCESVCVRETGFVYASVYVRVGVYECMCEYIPSVCVRERVHVCTRVCVRVCASVCTKVWVGNRVSVRVCVSVVRTEGDVCIYECGSVLRQCV